VTLSDAPASGQVSYSSVRQLDPLPFIFNEFEAEVQTYTVGSSSVLWTLSEAGASSPLLTPGESRDFWARYPTPDSPTDAVAVDAWVTPVANTDYTANSASDGTGTDLTSDVAVSVSKFAQTMKITLTNNGSQSAYVTLLQARGTPVTKDDPIKIRREDTTSQAAYGERTFVSRSPFIPDSSEADSWARYNLAIYKDPIPILRVRFAANDEVNLNQALQREVSDRVTVVATGNAGLGINEDFFIEAIRHNIRRGGLYWVEWDLSPVSGYSGFWVLGTSELGTGTVLGY
jgi:hypothetical protein